MVMTTAMGMTNDVVVLAAVQVEAGVDRRALKTVETVAIEVAAGR